MHRILPPIFRFLAQLVTLPHRRFYTPATDYKGVPADKGLRPIPSVLNLPGMVELEVDGVSTARTPASPYGFNRDQLKLRAGRIDRGGVMPGNGSGGPVTIKAARRGPAGGAREGLGLGLQELGGKDLDVVKHYDADGKRH